MTEPRVLVDAAAFMDSPQAHSLIAGARPASSATDVRTIVQRFLAACYTDLGKAPRHLDGEHVGALLSRVLPRHFGARDPLAAVTMAVLRAYFVHLQDVALVPEAFEIQRALAEHEAAFLAAVASGIAHRDGIAVTSSQPERLHRGTKVGRNDPCPCGSGKKFKKCCQRLGE